MLLNSGGTLHVDADVVAYSSSVSDERLKDNVKTIDNALDTVLKLRGVEYDWNSGSRKGKHDMGVIAQELEEVLPFLIKEHDTPYIGEDGVMYKTVDYQKIIGLLIEAIKELNDKIENDK